MSCCACCCFYPKYKRKVDNIFPRSLDGNLVRNEVDKLQYYSCQHPEKLSKIVDYLYQNLKWGLSGSYKNKNYVKNTVEAVNKILMVISPDYLNFFSIAYLKIIQKLLEQSDLEYQKLAIQSFKKFCEKERYQTTTNFQQRNYDTFVSIFSSMCFNNHNDENVRSEIRISGLQGIGAMVKNLSPDENVLQATYLWENMDKVISGLLYIMQEAYNRLMIQQQQQLQQQQQMPNSSSILTSAKGDLYSRLGPCVNNDETISTTMDNSKMKEIKLDRIEVSIDNSADESNKFEMRNLSSIYQQQQQQLLNGDKEKLEPCLEAELLLKEISIKSDFTTIIRVITPILKYMDNNNGSGWQQSEFVKKVFQTLMNNVKQQHSIIIKELMKHLDSHRNSDPVMKSSIIRVISMCIQISALYSIGTNAQIIEIFTSLLKQLNLSLEKSLSLPQGGKAQQQQQQQVLSPTAALVASINDSGLSRNTTDSVRDQEIRFQHEILNAMKNFTSQLPDYAKNDVIMYLTRQINSHQFTYTDNLNNADTQQRRARDHFNEQLRNKYLDALFEICTKYKSTQLFAAFTSAPILEDILKLTLINDPQSRRKTHEILHYLLDKNQNIDKLRQFQEEQKSRYSSNATTVLTSKYRSMVDLFSVTLPHRDDVHFMRKYGRLFLSHITEAVFIKNNTKANYEAALITLLLFIVGICDEEFLPELINFGFHIQELALINYNELNIEQKCSINALLTVYFDMLCKLYPTKKFTDYVYGIILIRKSDQYRKYLYPDYAYTDIKEGGSKFIGNSSGTTTLSAKDIEFDKEYDTISEEFSLAIKDQCDSDKDSGINEQLNLRTINIESLGKNSNLDSSWLFDKNRVFEAFSDRKFKERPNESYSLSSGFINNPTYKTSLTFRSIAGFVYQNSLSKQGSESNLSLNRFHNDVNPTTRVGNSNGHKRNNTATSINKPNGDDTISISSTTYDCSIASSVDDVRFAENRDLKFFIDNRVDSNDQTIMPQSTVDIALKRANLQTTLRPDGVLAFDTIRTILTNPKVQFSTSNYLIKDDNNNSNGINSTDAGGGIIQPNGVVILQNNEMNNYEKQKVLNDFKQKTFEEVKYDLNNYNQVNKDKFNKVLEFINSNNSTSASAGSSNNVTDSQSTQTNYVPLNNIEFPRVFLY